MHLALEVRDARDVGQLPAREGADRGEQDVGDVVELLGLAGVGRAADADVPLAGRLIVLRVHDFVAELDVGPDLVLVDDALEVLLDLVSGGVECRPVTLRERVGKAVTCEDVPLTLSSNEY